MAMVDRSAHGHWIVAAAAVAGYLVWAGSLGRPAEAGPAGRQTIAPTATAAVSAPRTTVVAPAISTVEPQEQRVEPETSVAQAETGSALAESDGGPPFRAIGIGAGVGAAAAVLALGVVLRIIRRRRRAP